MRWFGGNANQEAFRRIPIEAQKVRSPYTPCARDLQCKLCEHVHCVTDTNYYAGGGGLFHSSIPDRRIGVNFPLSSQERREAVVTK
jgi:hypothetical protein